MVTSKRKFWHVSPAVNRHGILREGLLPSRDRRGKGRVWFCLKRSIKWATSHVKKTQKYDGPMDLYECSPLAWRKRRNGIYYSFGQVPVRLVKTL